MRLNQLLGAIGRTATILDGGTDGAANDTTRGPAVVPAGSRPNERPSRRPTRARNSAREGHQRRTASAFSQAAQRYDPERIAQHDLRELADFLYQQNAISARDRLILYTDPTGSRMAVARDLAGPRNALVDWQDRRIHDMTNGRVNAVEACTRALSILGRISTLRRESGEP